MGISVVNVLGMMLGWAIIVIDNTIGNSVRCALRPRERYTLVLQPKNAAV